MDVHVYLEVLVLELVLPSVGVLQVQLDMHYDGLVHFVEQEHVVFHDVVRVVVLQVMLLVLQLLLLVPQEVLLLLLLLVLLLVLLFLVLVPQEVLLLVLVQ